MRRSTQHYLHNYQVRYHPSHYWFGRHYCMRNILLLQWFPSSNSIQLPMNYLFVYHRRSCHSWLQLYAKSHLNIRMQVFQSNRRNYSHLLFSNLWTRTVSLALQNYLWGNYERLSASDTQWWPSSRTTTSWSIGHCSWRSHTGNQLSWCPHMHWEHSRALPGWIQWQTSIVHLTITSLL